LGWNTFKESDHVVLDVVVALDSRRRVGRARRFAASHCAGTPTHPETTKVSKAQIAIPASIKAEHEEIHGELIAASKAPGRVGEAARALAAVLHPHFVREEEIALPPLGLLAPLAQGETSREMRDVLAMTDSLKAELPRMLEEHKAIQAATTRLGEVARAEGSVAIARLAEKLAVHAASEEEVFYPAAVLVGDLVRARVPKR
jgi:hypothetical protein